ncbi:hypothetical protein ACFSMW_02225 [Virgibacillus halophilus]|uniref:Uncharacterized protein n=1 Tax=Tigheibacillus halophilus TaxID=361280 RepID=A0ABU5CBQ3_9BACI|nr:hypothetical protein [Virgibacillus halophilus]
MGYILPIRFEQYENYQQCISNRTKDKYPIEKPFKTILETQYEEVKGAVPEQRKNHSEALDRHNQQISQSYAQFTGKGIHFSGIV